jgi:ubiquinone/menaquinone biosynthesis C-methylase UbiE
MHVKHLEILSNQSRLRFSSKPVLAVTAKFSDVPMQNDAQYNVASPDSLAVQLAVYQRRRMFAYFIEASGIEPTDTLLDVGVTSDRSYQSSNYVEAWYAEKDKITALGLDDASFLQQVYPGLTFVRGNALALPFADQSFDVVHSSAVIEHVGSFQNQVRLISELIRVARKFVYITTPNRWFPVEFHTILPFVHWLPKKIFRAFLRRTGRQFFAEESNLNLLTPSELRSASLLANSRSQFHIEATMMRLAFWPANLILICRRVGQA